MYLALRLVALMLALPLASSEGRPAFVPRVTMERSVVRLAGKRFVLTTTTRTYPLIFNRDVERLGHHQKASTDTVILAQIEEAVTASDRRWNAAARARIEAMVREAYSGVGNTGAPVPARQTTVEASVEPVAVAPGIIAAQLHWYVYPQEFFKGWGSTRAFIWSERALRALTAEDLFDPATRWWRALVPKMLEAAYEEPVAAVQGYEALERAQTPMIGAEGMCLKFHESETGSFVLAQPICLPWTQVQPYLRKDLPFDPGRLEERRATTGYD